MAKKKLQRKKPLAVALPKRADTKPVSMLRLQTFFVPVKDNEPRQVQGYVIEKYVFITRPKSSEMIFDKKLLSDVCTTRVEALRRGKSRVVWAESYSEIKEFLEYHTSHGKKYADLKSGQHNVYVRRVFRSKAAALRQKVIDQRKDVRTAQKKLAAEEKLLKQLQQQLWKAVPGVKE